MNLIEYEAKALLSAASIPTPKGVRITKRQSDAPFLPAVLKSQVPVGGRGKAGGIIVAKTEEEFADAHAKIFSLAIKDHLPKSLLVEELLSISKEFYLSALVDRDSMSIMILANRHGGIEVEDNHDFAHWTINDRSDADTIGQAIADYYQLPDKTFVLQDIIERLFDCLVKNDATLVEINPLILTDDGKLIAGDAKMILDDAASFRHDWQFEATAAETNFVTINQEGNVATIANGAGLAMATVDAAYAAGLTPANFLDIGGGASTETLLAAFERIVTYPNVQAIIINVFAGITKADEVAKAIVAAREQIDTLPPLFIRIAGTNYELAKKILDDAGVSLTPTLEDCLFAAKGALDA